MPIANEKTEQSRAGTLLHTMQQPSKRRRPNDKQSTAANTSHNEVCSFVTQFAGVITDWGEEDEQTPIDITVAAAIASIVPQQVYTKQRLHAKLASALSGQTPTRERIEKRARRSHPVEPESMLTGTKKSPRQSHELVASDPALHAGKSDHIGTVQEAAAASVDPPTIVQHTEQKADAADHHLPKPSCSAPYARYQSTPTSTHTHGGGTSVYNEGLVLVVEQSTPAENDDGDEDEDEDEDYIDDGQDDEENDQYDEDEDDEVAEAHDAETAERNAESTTSNLHVLPG